LLAAGLVGCGSVPVATLMRLPTFNEGNVSFLDANALRVKVSLPKGFVLDVANTRIVAKVDATGASSNSPLALDYLGRADGRRRSGLLGKDVDVTTVEMDLTDESVKALRETQALIARGKLTGVSLKVDVNVKQSPPGATSTQVWVDLLLSPIEGYFPLVEGATIELNPATKR